MIPDSARLLDLIHMPDPSADLVLMAWQKRGRTTKAPIGVSADGPFILDLSADGPHAPGRGHHRSRQVRTAADDHRRRSAWPTGRTR